MEVSFWGGKSLALRSESRNGSWVKTCSSSVKTVNYRCPRVPNHCQVLPFLHWLWGGILGNGKHRSCWNQASDLHDKELPQTLISAKAYVVAPWRSEQGWPELKYRPSPAGEEPRECWVFCLATGAFHSGRAEERMHPAGLQEVKQSWLVKGCNRLNYTIYFCY